MRLIIIIFLFLTNCKLIIDDGLYLNENSDVIIVKKDSLLLLLNGNYELQPRIYTIKSSQVNFSSYQFCFPENQSERSIPVGLRLFRNNLNLITKDSCLQQNQLFKSKFIKLQNLSSLKFDSILIYSDFNHVNFCKITKAQLNLVEYNSIISKEQELYLLLSNDFKLINKSISHPNYSRYKVYNNGIKIIDKETTYANFILSRINKLCK